jgi:hypothetical protein
MLKKHTINDKNLWVTVDIDELTVEESKILFTSYELDEEMLNYAKDKKNVPMQNIQLKLKL